MANILPREADRGALGTRGARNRDTVINLMVRVGDGCAALLVTRM
jgi:hypothetical protein